MKSKLVSINLFFYLLNLTYPNKVSVLKTRILRILSSNYKNININIIKISRNQIMKKDLFQIKKHTYKNRTNFETKSNTYENGSNPN